MEVKFNAGDMCAIPDGCKATIKDGVIIFEKEESKEQEFKRGDVIVSKINEILLVDVHCFENRILRSFVHIQQDGIFINSSYSLWNERYTWRHATEEEKQLLFDKMKEQGLLWNAEKKRVEKIRWRAEYGCRYYLVTSCLKVGSDIDFRHTGEEERLEFGNYFRTKEQAEEAAKRVKETLRNYHEEIKE
ncbi:MAG: hypothetical protein HXN87_05590 [Prevotella pallens]|uniref:hypothetical protein n=1 Tax=Prevotella pallens TaxID=60133 RepID=UPI001CB65719|nr:hypothetical protein [Prevotella pallens]MBF1519453.1 hypothetical protein [Prevotella pallens]